MARMVYHMLKYRVQYEDIGAEAFGRLQRERDVAILRKRRRQTGLQPRGKRVCTGGRLNLMLLSNAQFLRKAVAIFSSSPERSTHS
jgi:hypothetical protein